jgi:RNA recognition motif-containing protein
MNIFVGNLSRQTEENDLQEAFATYGQVSTVKIVKDMYSGQSRGFGFVEMPAKAEADVAIYNLNGKEIKGRAIKVNEARARS